MNKYNHVVFVNINKHIQYIYTATVMVAGDKNVVR